MDGEWCECRRCGIEGVWLMACTGCKISDMGDKASGCRSAAEVNASHTTTPVGRREQLFLCGRRLS